MEIINNAIAFERADEYCRVVVFADSPDSPKHFFMMQKAHEYDEQDERLGMNKIHLQMDDESRSCYGGLKMVTFGFNVVEIEISDEAALNLGTDSTVKILLRPDVDSLAAIGVLKEMLIEDGVKISGSCT